MHHVLRVCTEHCEGAVEHGYFEAEDLQEAIDCAKAHKNPYDSTIVEACPFGARVDDKGNPIGERSPMTVWAHHPEQCQAAIGRWPSPTDCEVCTKYLADVRKEEEETRMKRARGEID